jgi:hypothetical protein
VTDESAAVDVSYQAVAVPSARPTSVLVLGVIGIVLGGFGVLCKPGGVVLNLFIPMPVHNPVVDFMRNDPQMRLFMIASGGSGTLISLLLLMSSIGSLRLKEWARTGMLAYACLALLSTAIEQAVGYLIIMPEMQRVMRQAGMPPQMAWTMGPAAQAVGLAIRLWYPPLILVYFTRARVKEAFALGLPRRDI